MFLFVTIIVIGCY